MAIVQAYQCPYTKRLFDLNDKPKYVKHLKKMASTTFPLHKAERYAETFNLKDFRDSVQSLDHLNELLINNFHKYLSLLIVDLDFNVCTRYAKKFNKAFRESSIVDKCYIKNNSSSGFWVRNQNNSNYSFLGLQGSCEIQLKREHGELLTFGPDLIRCLGFHTQSGSCSTNGGTPVMNYDFYFNAMDWKFVARLCVLDYLKTQIPRHTNFDTDNSWHNYYRILIDTHWPGVFNELQPLLNLYSSLGAGHQEIYNLIESKLNIGLVKDVEIVPLPIVEF